MNKRRNRRVIVLCIVLLCGAVSLNYQGVEPPFSPMVLSGTESDAKLDGIAVKGRAPKTGYSRSEFGNGWDTSSGCDTRNNILQRDLRQVELDQNACKVLSGILDDPYTGKTVPFIRGDMTSDDVQIDHVVALSNAWQTGAQQLTYSSRVMFANDPLNLFAVDGPTNEKKSDGDAATWLPPNKSFRCQYVTRQIKVKAKYRLWMTPAEHDATSRVLATC